MGEKKRGEAMKGGVKDERLNAPFAASCLINGVCCISEAIIAYSMFSKFLLDIQLGGLLIETFKLHLIRVCFFSKA